MPVKRHRKLERRSKIMNISFQRILVLLAILLFSALLIACTTASPTSSGTEEAQEILSTQLPAIEPTASPVPSTATFTSIPPTETQTKTATNPPTATSTETSTVTATITNTPTITKAPNVSSETKPVNSDKFIKIYFILQGTGGPICGTDSLIPLTTDIKRGPDVEKNIKSALNRLFSYRSEWNGNLYNPLFRSKMKAKRVEFDPGSRSVLVTLSGTYTPSGDDCDNTRVRAQVWSTIRQFRGVSGVHVYFENGIKLGDRLSNDK